jgi:hypothetical protein
VDSPSPEPTPDWKDIVIASPDWPVNIVIPQNDALPEDSESLVHSTSIGNEWVWELWRHPDAHCYYLKVWRPSEAALGRPDTPGAVLTVLEAFRFCLTNWMPRDVVADFVFEHPELVKSLDFPAGTPGRN